MFNSLNRFTDNFSKIKGDQVDYIPLKSGNTLNLNKFITDINNNTWYIDYQGSAISLGEHLTWRNIAETIIEHLNLLTELSKKAPIDSPNLMGNPTSVTPLTYDCSNSIATTEFVNNLIETKLNLNNNNLSKMYKIILLSESIEINVKYIMFKISEKGKIYIKAINEACTVFIDNKEFNLNLIYQLIDTNTVEKNESLNYEVIAENNVYNVSVANFKDIVLHILIEKYL